MTGGVCPVHGEYAPTGVCRWCEAPAAKAKAARMKVLREAVVLADWRRNLRAPLSWRMEYADPVTLVGLNAAEESRLLAQHAALRWERVARRWATKHPTMLDLANGWTVFVIEAMRKHAEKLARANPLLQDKPWEPKP